MTQMRIDFQGRGEVQTFSGARVEAMGDGVQLALRVSRQVRALGQVLAQQAIRILVGAALPRAVRIGKEDLEREPLGQLLVLGHFFPPIIGQGLPQQRGHMSEFFREALTSTPCIRPLHPGQNDQARRPLHQRPDGRTIAGSFDEITFPMARHRAGGHLRGALSNRRHMENLASSIGPSRPRSARLARLTERRQQLATQGSAWQHIQRHIDGLCREVFPHVVRIRALEPPGNLLGRAALGQMRPHALPEPRVEECARPPRLTCAGCGPRLCGAGAIRVTSRGVAAQLAAHGAGGSPQHPRHRPQRVAVGQAQTQGLTVCVTQARVVLF